MDIANKYKIVHLAITQYFDNKLKNLDKEKLDLYTAQDILDQCKEVQIWFDNLYNENKID